MFIKVRLQLRDGSLVHESMMPRFIKTKDGVQHPEVIVWGSRIFALADELDQPCDASEVIYNEAFSFYVT